MLRRLLICDFVLVDRLELEFRAGFGVLTGETGAGKSILLDALALLLGERADAGVVRAGCDKADLSAEFDLPPDAGARDWLLAQDFEVAEESVLLRRVIESSGRSRAYINGAAATATQLRELGDFLADIHGQHAHHALLKADAQRLLLDAHADLLPQAREVATLYKAWQTARRLREAAQADQAGIAHERDLLEFQAKELSELACSADEWEPLNQEHDRLAHAASLIEGVSMALDALTEGEAPMQPEAERLAGKMEELSHYDAGLGDIAQLVSEAAIRLDEAAHALRRYRERVELDPERLQTVAQRMADIMSLARKYRVAPDELEALLADTRARLDALAAQGDAAALAEREQAAQAQFRALAQELSARRQQAAQALGAAVSAAMQDLAMAGGCFEVALQPEEEGAAYGLERVEFLVAANPQQAPKPLGKVASGGELSRIGLAIQVITSEAQSVPTLIFDEVDVGIGGGVAEVVGRRLHELGRQRQVLCVTHLPQVAAQADWQWKVVKENTPAGSLSRLSDLDAAARVDEIARMLGGIQITDTTRSHAAELLGTRAP